ncbi:MAG: hypothetical protein FWB91_12625, partial [Defluviitaleaceae bacterium]|nr:hypothetical protein [Defluviitaleaceae bacterium]
MGHIIILALLGGGVLGFLLCYFILRGRALQQNTNAQIETGNGDISLLLNELQRVRKEIQTDNWYARGDLQKLDG